MQSVTIREYFSEMRKAQRSALPQTKFMWAKRFLTNRCDLDLQETGLLIYLKTKARHLQIEPGLLAAQYALKELNLQIEEDLMEFCAEYGLETLEAIKADREADLKEGNDWYEYGYVTNRKPYKEVELLKEVMDLEVVTSKSRPLYIHDVSNPFLVTDDDDPFVENILPFDQNKKKSELIITLPDWDKMTEEEWQHAKESQNERLLADRIARESENTRVSNQKLGEASKLKTKEFPDWVYDA